MSMKCFFRSSQDCNSDGIHLKIRTNSKAKKNHIFDLRRLIVFEKYHLFFKAFLSKSVIINQFVICYPQFVASLPSSKLHRFVLFKTIKEKNPANIFSLKIPTVTRLWLSLTLKLCLLHTRSLSPLILFYPLDSRYSFRVWGAVGGSSVRPKQSFRNGYLCKQAKTKLES